MKWKHRGLALFIAAASGAFCLVFTAAGESVAASAGTNGSHMSHASPEWPFVGTVDVFSPNFWSTGFAELLHGIRYRSSFDGNITELDIASGDEVFFCGSEFYAGPLGVWFSYRGDRLDSVDVYVPWGDTAYPMYTSSLLTDNWDHWGPNYWQPTTMVGGSVVEAEYADYGWIAVSVDGEERYYRTGSAEWYEDEVDPSEFVPPPEPPPEWEIGSLVRTSGSDGVHYGISFFVYDTTCEGPDNYVFSVDSGELVACGAGFMGPVFVAPRATLVSAPSPAFPTLSYWGDYRHDCGDVFSMDELRYKTSNAMAEDAKLQQPDR